MGALALEAIFALTLGVLGGHPRIALAGAFWALPVFVIFVPLDAKWNRLDRKVLGIGTPAEDRRSILLNLTIFGSIALAVLIAIVVALLT